ncbi:hypothetical protein GGI07_001804 [Coemansia sp. Benny D115]|nr:hypothetical protein GGI07_001804 [Coemansia sp. Benny D115]
MKCSTSVIKQINGSPGRQFDKCDLEKPCHQNQHQHQQCAKFALEMQAELTRLLQSLDGSQYGQYKQLLGRQFNFEQFTLQFDRIQADAFAPPSRIRIRIPQTQAQFPGECYSTRVRAVATAHFLSRVVHDTLSELQGSSKDTSSGSGGGRGGWGSAKGGVLSIDCPGQEVIERTSVTISGSTVEVRLTASLPAAGRTILGTVAQRMLLGVLPQLVRQALVHASIDARALQGLITCVEDQECLRAQLAESGLVAFVGDGAVLPRSSGVNSLPLSGAGVVAFRSPQSLQRTFTLRSGRQVTGMGVPHGVTLICGGGFNGKSTLLQALELGVYNHVPGDGRELVVTDAAAAKIKAEEGRHVSGTDIRPFINHLPFAKDTARFSTSDASGSTSMAASIQEALEAGATAMLFDEDTCATNFLIRDGRMQRLVAQRREPITPLVSRIRELWSAHRVSCVLVVGGCGDYLDVADTVIDMCEYSPADATERARAIAAEMPVSIEPPSTSYGAVPSRTIVVAAELGRSSKPPKVLSRSSIALFPWDSSAGKTEGGSEAESYAAPTSEQGMQPVLDLSALDQLVSSSQTRSIARIVHALAQTGAKRKTMRDWLDSVDDQSLDGLCAALGCTGDLARPRRLEVAQAINRLRYARMDS